MSGGERLQGARDVHIQDPCDFFFSLSGLQELHCSRVLGERHAEKSQKVRARSATIAVLGEAFHVFSGEAPFVAHGPDKRCGRESGRARGVLRSCMRRFYCAQPFACVRGSDWSGAIGDDASGGGSGSFLLRRTWALWSRAVWA